MIKTIQIQEVSATDFKEMLAEAVRTELNDFKKVLLQSQPENKSDLLTPEEVCSLLGISKVTLWNYTNDDKFKVYGIGQKRYYKRSEILKSLEQKK